VYTALWCVSVSSIDVAFSAVGLFCPVFCYDLWAVKVEFDILINEYEKKKNLCYKFVLVII